MAVMQMVVVACLGMKNAPGRSAERSWNKSPEKFLSRRGLIKRKGKMVIFTVSNHSENKTNRTGSTKQRRGLWVHLKRGCEQKVIARRSLGTNL